MNKTVNTLKRTYKLRNVADKYDVSKEAILNAVKRLDLLNSGAISIEYGNNGNKQYIFNNFAVKTIGNYLLNNPNKIYGIKKMAEECNISEYKLYTTMEKYKLIDDDHIIARKKGTYKQMIFDDSVVQFIKDYVENGVPPKLPKLLDLPDDAIYSNEEPKKEDDDFMTNDLKENENLTVDDVPFEDTSSNDTKSDNENKTKKESGIIEISPFAQNDEEVENTSKDNASTGEEAKSNENTNFSSPEGGYPLTDAILESIKAKYPTMKYFLESIPIHKQFYDSHYADKNDYTHFYKGEDKLITTAPLKLLMENFCDCYYDIERIIAEYNNLVETSKTEHTFLKEKCEKYDNFILKVKKETAEEYISLKNPENYILLDKETFDELTLKYTDYKLKEVQNSCPGKIDLMDKTDLSKKNKETKCSINLGIIMFIWLIILTILLIFK